MLKKEAGVVIALMAIIIPAILIIAVLGFFAYQFHTENVSLNKSLLLEKEKYTELEDSLSTQREDLLNTQNEEIKKIDQTKELVYTYYSDYHAQSDERPSSSVEIPIINLDYPSVDYINREIARACQEAKDEDYFFIKHKYISSLNDNILSLVLYWENETSYRRHAVYNIDVYTGNVLSNQEILAYKNITNYDIYQRIEKIMKQIIDKFSDEPFAYLDSTNMNNMTTFYFGALSDSEGNAIGLLQLNEPMYMDSNGNLHMIVYIFTGAGAGYGFYDINLNNPILDLSEYGHY